MFFEENKNWICAKIYNEEKSNSIEINKIPISLKSIIFTIMVKK